MTRYDVIYADPPWSYNKKVGQGIADDQYNTMNLEDIKGFSIPCKENSVLLMWATFPMLKEAFEVIESWGFEYKTVAFNWIKLNKNGKPFFGMGHYTKSNSEVCLLATKGDGLEVRDHTISQIVMSVRGEHSRKPKEVYALIEKLYGDVSKIELFARHKREGWCVWGNEVPVETQKLLKVDL